MLFAAFYAIFGYLFSTFLSILDTPFILEISAVLYFAQRYTRSFENSFCMILEVQKIALTSLFGFPRLFDLIPHCRKNVLE